MKRRSPIESRYAVVVVAGLGGLFTVVNLGWNWHKPNLTS
jgi:hypothetical protein